MITRYEIVALLIHEMHDKWGLGAVHGGEFRAQLGAAY
jgi:hypothetical protein